MFPFGGGSSSVQSQALSLFPFSLLRESRLRKLVSFVCVFVQSLYCVSVAESCAVYGSRVAELLLVASSSRSSQFWSLLFRCFAPARELVFFSSLSLFPLSSVFSQCVDRPLQPPSRNRPSRTISFLSSFSLSLSFLKLLKTLKRRAPSVCIHQHRKRGQKVAATLAAVSALFGQRTRENIPRVMSMSACCEVKRVRRRRRRGRRGLQAFLWVSDSAAAAASAENSAAVCSAVVVGWLVGWLVVVFSAFRSSSVSSVPFRSVPFGSVLFCFALSATGQTAAAAAAADSVALAGTRRVTTEAAGYKKLPQLPLLLLLLFNLQTSWLAEEANVGWWWWW